MNLGDTFKNPWVLGGGALIGIVLLLRSSDASATVSANMDAVNPTIMGQAVAMNATALGAQVQLAQISANLGATAFQADTTKQVAFYSLMKAFDDNETQVRNQQVISQAGIANSLITSGTAIIVDQANNANRLALAYQETARAEVGANKDIAVASLQAQAQKAVSKNNMIGTIAGGALNVLSHTLPLAFGG